jgi:hypothetical protein
MTHLSAKTSRDLIGCIAWYYSSSEITPGQLREFIEGIAIDEPDGDLVQEIHLRYQESIDYAGKALADKFKY